MVDSVVNVSVVMNAAQHGVEPLTTGSSSVFDLAHFDALYQQADVSAPAAADLPAGDGFAAAVRALDALNNGATDLGDRAVSLAADLQSLTPGDMLHLTVQAHHFVFQSQLTANVANRTSEGIQQLFRQQS